MVVKLWKSVGRYAMIEQIHEAGDTSMTSLAHIRKTAMKILQFLLNPHLLLCVGIAWLITNGWSYIMLATGTYWQIGWMIAVSTAYLAFLWLPVSPEKIVTVLIAMALLRLFFPKDQKTLGVLRELHRKLMKKDTTDHDSAHHTTETEEQQK